MDTILGIRGADFAILATDMICKNSIVVMRQDEQRVYKVAENLMIAVIGQGGDAMQFADYVSKNIILYKIRHGYDLTPKSAAHFTRQNLSEYLRSSTPFNVYLLIAGYDSIDGAELYFLDFLANGKSINYGGHGYGNLFAGSIFERYWHKDLSQAEAVDIIKMCIVEIHKRLVINLTNFSISIVDKDGSRELEVVTPDTLVNFKSLVMTPNKQ